MHIVFDFLMAFVPLTYSMSSILFPLLMIHMSQIQGQIFPNPERMMAHIRIVFQVKHDSNIGVIFFFFLDLVIYLSLDILFILFRISC